MLRTILNTAIEDKLIKTNPCTIKEAGQEKNVERPIATLEQVFELAKVIDQRYRLAILLATFGGLRLGEIFGLEITSIDLESKTLKVDQRIQELSNGFYVIFEPKTKASLRTIALSDFMIQELKNHISAFSITTGSKYLLSCDN